jgi:hypothetical protein
MKQERTADCENAPLSLAKCNAKPIITNILIGLIVP